MLYSAINMSSEHAGTLDINAEGRALGTGRVLSPGKPSAASARAAGARAAPCQLGAVEAAQAPCGVLCAKCTRSCSMTIPDLERRVAEELRGKGINERIHWGVVTIEC